MKSNCLNAQPGVGCCLPSATLTGMPVAPSRGDNKEGWDNMTGASVAPVFFRAGSVTGPVSVD
jgi:hypothetical protein